MTARLLIALFWISGSLQAEANQASDSTRYSRIEEFNRGIYVAPLVKYRYPSVVLRGTDPQHQGLSYRPNIRYISGIRVMAFGINFEVSKSISQGDRITSRFGKTEASDFLINAMTRRWFGDLQWLNYKGIYLRRSWEDYQRNNPLPLRPDISILIRTISATWIMKPSSLSLRSAYSFREKQIVSGGSPLLRISMNRLAMSGDSTLVGKNDLQYFRDLTDITGTVIHVLGIAPGYGYNFVRNDFFVSGTVVAGPANYWIREDRDQGGSSYFMKINLVASIGLAAGYNGDRFFGGINYRVQGFTNRLNETRLTSNQNVIQLMAGYRFLERGVFMRRVQHSLWWPF